MNGKRFSQEKARRSGFYLALAVCLVAVGVAAWSTYDAVNSYARPAVSQGEESQPAPSSSGDPEDAEGEEASSPRATPAPAREAAGPVSQPATPRPTATPAPTPTASPTPQPQPANAPLYAVSQEMIWPIEGGEAQQAYSAGAPVYSPTMRDWRIHAGLDVAAQPQAPVMACANGLVRETYTDAMLGNVCVVEHGEYLFSYCGLGENFLVEPGEVVSAGQQLGVVTAVPQEAAEEPHLHLEVRRDGAPLDPQPLLEGAA